MRKAALIATLLVALGGCRQAGNGSSEPPPPELTSGDLEQAVLDTTDAGKEWTEVKNVEPNTVQIGGRLGAANFDPSPAQATSAFAHNGGTGYISNSVFLRPSTSDARWVISEHKRLATKKTWTQERNDGSTARFTRSGSVAGVVTLGDDMFAARLKVKITPAAASETPAETSAPDEAPTEPTDYVLDYVVYRIGAVVAFVATQDVAAASYATRQEDKLARVVRA